jgi:hypothetical protein
MNKTKRERDEAMIVRDHHLAKQCSNQPIVGIGSEEKLRKGARPWQNVLGGILASFWRTN